MRQNNLENIDLLNHYLEYHSFKMLILSFKNSTNLFLVPALRICLRCLEMFGNLALAIFVNSAISLYDYMYKTLYEKEIRKAKKCIVSLKRNCQSY